jgi:mercuric ion binding protein
MRFLVLFFLSLPAFAADVRVSVKGMVCGFCAQGVSEKFKGVPGVEKADVSLEKKLVTLHVKDGQKLTDDKIKEVIEDAGYTVEKIER